MAGKDRNQRRAQKLARNKKRRADVARPARDGGSAGSVSFKAGLGWPPGDCFATAGYDHAGAHIHAVFTRSHSDGRTVAAFVEVDRSGPGVLAARVLTLPSTGSVYAECGRLSEQDGEIAFQGVPPSTAAGILVDAAEHGSTRRPEAWGKVLSMIEGVHPDAMDEAFGPAPEKKVKRPGLLDRLFRFLG